MQITAHRVPGPHGGFGRHRLVPGEVVALDDRTRERDLGISLPSVSTFGEDSAGELYVVSQEQGVFRLVPA